MQQIELIVKAENWTLAQATLARLGISKTPYTEHKKLDGLFIVTIKLSISMDNQVYTNIKDSSDVGILSDSASQKRAEEVFREVYKVETRLRRLLLHVSDAVEAYYEILLQMGQYTHAFSNNEPTSTYKGSLNTMMSHLTMGELIQIMRFDFSWSSRLLGAGDLNALLQESVDFNDFKVRVDKKAKPISVWEVVTQQILQKSLPWEQMEKKLMKLKKHRDHAAHHFIFTENQKSEAVKLAKEISQELSPHTTVTTSLSSSQISALNTASQQITESLRTIIDNSGVLSVAAAQQKVIAKILEDSNLQKSIADSLASLRNPMLIVTDMPKFTGISTLADTILKNSGLTSFNNINPLLTNMPDIKHNTSSQNPKDDKQNDSNDEYNNEESKDDSDNVQPEQ